MLAIYGPSGSGKSHIAFSVDEYFIKDNSHWWDGYRGEKIVIWDEFNSSKVDCENFLKWTDKYPTRVQVKGAYKALALELLITTANEDPRNWYAGDYAHVGAVARRTTAVLEVRARNDLVWHKGDKSMFPEIKWDEFE